MSTRMDFVARLPWVTRLEKTRPCDGYRWSHMPGKALRDPELRVKYKCKARARWRFRALPESRRNPFPAQDGTYCWSHLHALGLWHGPAEEARTKRKLADLRAADDWNETLAGSAARLAQAGEPS